MNTPPNMPTIPQPERPGPSATGISARRKENLQQCPGFSNTMVFVPSVKVQKCTSVLQLQEKNQAYWEQIQIGRGQSRLEAHLSTKYHQNQS